LTYTGSSGIFAGLEIIPLKRSKIWLTVPKQEKELGKEKSVESEMLAKGLWRELTLSE
jgi:hypothetical protein|tara:strand:+ start:425 stop:598 length:174 start_codon:yes stop_codon:yes gene_type:complete